MKSGSDAGVTRWASVLPWLAGVLGTLVFLRPLWRGPGTLILDRVFWYDTLVNIDDLAELHTSFSRGMGHSSFWDWLYGGHFFYPQPRPLVTSELMPLAALVTWPLAGHPILAYNVLLIASTILNCVVGASFARILGARPLSATFAGIAFTFSAYTNFVSSRLQLIFLFPIAFCLVCTIRWARTGQWKHAFGAAVWALAQAMLCLYYAIFLGVALLVVAVTGRLSFPRPGAARDTVRLGVAFAAVAPVGALVLWPYRELKSALGVKHLYEAVVGQSGDLQMFAWADRSTIASHWNRLFDKYAWDTSHFPGVMVCLGLLVAIVLWVRRDPRHRLVMSSLLVGAAVFVAVRLLPVALLLLLVATIMLVIRARQSRVNFVVPALLVLIVTGLILFWGPEPHAFEKPIGWSPYTWLYAHAPFFDGLRMVRRAAVLVQLALCTTAALAWSEIERRRFGWVFLSFICVAAIAEGQPLELKGRRIPNSCEDQAMKRAGQEGATVVGDLPPSWLTHPELSLRRHEATMCGVAVTQGFGGLWPPLGELATDAVMSLPDRAAYVWLWNSGVKHIIVRDVGPRTIQTQKRFGDIAQSVEPVGRDVLVTLRPPAETPFEAPKHLDGPRIHVREAQCSKEHDCHALIDGVETARWTSGAKEAGGEQIILRFDEAEVSGIEWHATDATLDLPRGLRVEREVRPGEWQLWRDIPSLSPLRLGRDAVPPAYAIPLETLRTTAVRITQTGKSYRYWLSASEIEVIGAQGPQGTAASH